MKKVISIISVAAFLFTMNVNAQETKPKKKAVKAEKAASCSTAEKKECATTSGKKSCCANK